MSKFLSRKEFIDVCSNNNFLIDLKIIFTKIEELLKKILLEDSESIYSLRMVRLHPRQKIKQIRFFRLVTGHGLKTSKESIESCNNFLGITLNNNASKNEAEYFIKEFLDLISRTSIVDEFSSNGSLPFEIEVNKLNNVQIKKIDNKQQLNELDKFKIELKRNGFIQVYYEEFLDDDIESIKIEEFYIYFQPSEGILIKFDTYWGKTCLNGGNMYYNWKPHSFDDYHYFISSGGFVNNNSPLFNVPDNELVWGGDHDIRYGIINILEKLRMNGTFITPWIGMGIYPFLTHFGDKCDNGKVDYYSKTYERIKKMPLFVYEATSYKKITGDKKQREEDWKNQISKKS